MDENTAALVKERASIREQISQLYKESNRVFLIHYACESFDRPAGSPCRITGIAVRNLKTGQSKSWTIYGEAERKRRTATIKNDLDILEKSLLNCFSKHLKNHDECTYVHWNMRDTKYGFSHFHRRAAALGVKLHKLQDSQKFDLSNAIYKLYGPEHAPAVAKNGTKGRIFSIAEINNISNAEAISGENEALAFARGDFGMVEGSTLRKLGMFSDIFDKLHRGNFKHNAPWKDTWMMSLSAGVYALKTHWAIVAFVFFSGLIFAFYRSWGMISGLFKPTTLN